MILVCTQAEWGKIDGVSECVQHPLTPNHNPTAGGRTVMAEAHSSKRRREDFIDMTGERFGRLTVVGLKPGSGYPARWICQCVCGGTAVATRTSLRCGHVSSCGCYQKEQQRAAVRVHGERRIADGRPSLEYRSWMGMRRRCYAPNSEQYRHYGGRGIKVCEAWRDDFAAFLQDVGRRPSPQHTLDRIDVNGNYEPRNVRWATSSQQRRNSRQAWYDLTGQSFGSYTVLRIAGKRGTHTYWHCQCDCGVEKAVRSDHLRNGGARSCRGCMSRNERGQWVPTS